MLRVLAIDTTLFEEGGVKILISVKEKRQESEIYQNAWVFQFLDYIHDTLMILPYEDIENKERLPYFNKSFSTISSMLFNWKNIRARC